MARKKTKDTTQLLARPIAFRVTAREYQRLAGLLRNSDCHSLGEVVRRILYRKPIKLFHRDASLDGPMEELASLRQELRSIGVNINQITRHFHHSSLEARRVLLAEQALEPYRQVSTRVDLLLTLISRLAGKW